MPRRLCLGFAYGGLSLRPLSPAKSEHCERRGAGERGHPIRRAGGRGAAHGARLDQYAGRGSWARANSRPRPAALAERHRRSYQEWVGEELLADEFSRHSCRGTGEQRGAPAARAALDAARGGIASLPRLTLVGKGVCFDSGGLDIKSARAWH